METSNILIQGLRGAGKTHLVGRIIDRLSGTVRIGGVFTEKIGSLVHLRVWDNYELMGKGPTEIVYDEEGRVVRTSVFEELGVWAVKRSMASAQLVVFDELGRFEQNCRRFTAAVHEALDQPAPVLSTLKTERNPFLDSLRERNDVLLLTLSPLNRNQVFEEVANEISEALEL
jgi:nucleoside-triphosphatase THEP1